MLDPAVMNLELLEHASAEELGQVVHVLRLEKALMSPLSLAEAVSEAERHPHQVLMDAWLVALDEGRLYFDGPGPFPVKVGGKLQHPTRGDHPVYNLQILMPPRHGKSFISSIHLPAWVLARHPSWPVLMVGYNETFAQGFGAQVRDIFVGNPWLGLRVRGDERGAAGMIQFEGHRGFLRCVGMGGALTGIGGRYLILDDPLKNHEEAMSQLIRDSHGNWFASTLYTRREPWPDGTPGRVIQIQTPWHEDDIAGRNVPEEPKMGDQWARLKLAAIFEPTEDNPTDPLGRAPGEALCEARVPLAELHKIREIQGESWFEAMYQCSPSLDEGNVVKRPFNYYTKRDGRYAFSLSNGEFFTYGEQECYRFATVDLAASLKEFADWTVMAVWDVTPSTPRHLLLADLFRVRIDTEGHEDRIVEWYEESGCRAVHVEDKTFGTNLIGRLRRRAGVVVQPLSADQQVLARVMPLAYEIRNERVWFPEHAAWLRDFEDELTKFPNAKWDDQVDAAAYGVQVLEKLPRHIEKLAVPESMAELAGEHFRQISDEKRGRGILPIIGRWR